MPPTLVKNFTPLLLRLDFKPLSEGFVQVRVISALVDQQAQVP